MSDPDTFARSQSVGLAVLQTLALREPPVGPPAQRAAKDRVCPAPKVGRGFRFTKFCLIGTLVFAVGAVLQWPLVRTLGTSLSYLVQTVLSVELSYVLNRLWTWGDREPGGAFWRWNLQRAGITALNLLGYDLLVRWHGMNWLTANVAVTAVFTVASYVLADRWSFAARFLSAEMAESVVAPHPSAEARASGVAVLQPLAVTERTPIAGDLQKPPFRISFRSWIARDPWPLLGILAVQTGLSIRLVWSNTAFSDESLYLWSGRLELDHFLYGTHIPAFQTYFSGAPVIYPIIGAIADSYGGLALARLLSLAFMLGATALLYAMTSRLFNRSAALCASAVFAVLGPVQVLGAFATYDAMAIFLLALGAWLVVRATGRTSELYLLAGGLTLAVADATKYATALWMPVVIVLAGLTAAAGGWRRALFRSTRLAGYVGIPLVVALFRFGGKAYLQGLMFTTIARQAGSTAATPQTVLADSFNWVGIVFVLALIGTIISFTVSDRTRWICCALTAAILLAPLHQAQIHTTTSLHKHVIFGAWFAAAVAGYLLDRAAKVNADKGWRVGAVVIAITCFIAIPQATSMFVYGWPNTTQMNAELAKVVPAAGCPCLITQQSQVRFYLPQLAAEDTVGPYYFTYWNNAEHKLETGVSAYVQAIRAHYFEVVEIDPAENLAIYAPVVRALSDTPGYRLLTSTRIDHWGRKTMQIWRYVGSGPR